MRKKKKEDIVLLENENLFKKDTISLNEYLSKYNGKRVLDNIIRKWYFKKNNTNPKKTKVEWDKLIEEFHNETER